jgi:hypothetical protein
MKISFYEASFETQSCPLWHGHLKDTISILIRYSIVTPSHLGRGNCFECPNSIRQKHQTLIGGSLADFQTFYQQYYGGHLNAAERDGKVNIINFIRLGDQYQTGKYWRLGDIFHSSPMSIGTPIALFYDHWDLATPEPFETFRANHVRTSQLVTAFALCLSG